MFSCHHFSQVHCPISCQQRAPPPQTFNQKSLCATKVLSRSVVTFPTSCNLLLNKFCCLLRSSSPSHRIFVCSGRKTRWESSPSQDQQQRLQDNAERKTSSSSSWLLNLLGFPGKLLGPGQNQARECVRLKKKSCVAPLLSVSPEIAASLVGKLLFLPRAENWGRWWHLVEQGSAFHLFW